jgi:hypothetical protein
MHKYRAVKQSVDGIVFPSGLEADTYRALRDIHNCGGMQNLRLQVPYVLHGIDGRKVCTYQLDFLCEMLSGQRFAFESKGVMTAVASLKLKLFSAEYGVPLVVIKSDSLRTLQTVSALVRSTVASYRPMAFAVEVEEQFLPKKKVKRRKSA